MKYEVSLSGWRALLLMFVTGIGIDTCVLAPAVIAVVLYKHFN